MSRFGGSSNVSALLLLSTQQPNRLPMLLAVETSGLQGSLAVAHDDRLVAERMLQTAGRRHAQTLVSEVDRVLKDLSLQPADIRSVAVSIGPGSFTGLRVGLVFAKTFAWLNQAMLVAVDTLQAIAQQAPPEMDTVTAISEAQRGEVFAATYRWDAQCGCRRPIDNVRVATVESLSTEHAITGPALVRLRSVLEPTHRLVDESLWLPRSSTVAQIGQQMVRQGQSSVPETLEPVYIRVSYAEEKRNR